MIIDFHSNRVSDQTFSAFEFSILLLHLENKYFKLFAIDCPFIFPIFFTYISYLPFFSNKNLYLNITFLLISACFIYYSS